MPDRKIIKRAENLLVLHASLLQDRDAAIDHVKHYFIGILNEDELSIIFDRYKRRMRIYGILLVLTLGLVLALAIRHFSTK